MEPAGRLRVDALDKWYPRREAAPTHVLDGCSFEVEAGSLTVLMGASGCGKSTLAYILAGFQAPDRGSVTLDGAAVSGPGPERLMVFQETALWPWLTVLENVVFGPRCRRDLGRREAREQALALLARFGLAEFRDRYPDQLSGGMKRRVELAQALINRPKLMILDEPFRGLDVMTRELMQEYYCGLFEQERLTTLFITSELEEAIFLADTVLVMSASPGRVVASVAVDLPRPRRFEMLASERYLQIKRELLDALYRQSGPGPSDSPPGGKQT